MASSYSPPPRGGGGGVKKLNVILPTGGTVAVNMQVIYPTQTTPTYIIGSGTFGGGSVIYRGTLTHIVNTTYKPYTGTLEVSGGMGTLTYKFVKGVLSGTAMVEFAATPTRTPPNKAVFGPKNGTTTLRGDKTTIEGAVTFTTATPPKSNGNPLVTNPDAVGSPGIVITSAKRVDKTSDCTVAITFVPGAVPGLVYPLIGKPTPATPTATLPLGTFHTLGPFTVAPGVSNPPLIIPLPRGWWLRLNAGTGSGITVAQAVTY